MPVSCRAVRVPSFFAPAFSVRRFGGRLPTQRKFSSRVRKQLHRPARLPREQRRDDRVLAGLELAAEAAAHVVADHAHAAERQLEVLARAPSGGRRRPGSCPRRSARSPSHWPPSRGSPSGVWISHGVSEGHLDHDRRPRRSPSPRRRARSLSGSPARLPPSWTAGAPASSASSESTTNGSSSYSTAIARAASRGLRAASRRRPPRPPRPRSGSAGRRARLERPLLA